MPNGIPLKPKKYENIIIKRKQIVAQCFCFKLYANGNTCIAVVGIAQGPTQSRSLCSIGRLLLDLKSNQYLNQEIQAFDVELNPANPRFPAQQLTFKGAPGALCIVFLSLMYAEKTFAGKAVLNSQEISPAAVLRAEFCPGESISRERWSKMVFNDKKKRKSLKKKKINVDEVKNLVSTCNSSAPLTS